MNLLRGVGRMLLGGFFIANGVKAVRDPGPFVEAAQPLADRVVPLVQGALPPEVSAYVPQDTKTLVRVNGVAQVLGGLGMATGISSKGGGTLAALSMLPHVVAAKEAGADAATSRSLLVRNLALLGAALVVSQDTRGKPSLLWKANATRVQLSRDAERAKKSLAKDASHVAELTMKDFKRLKREAQLQAKAARKSIEGALP
ncbi:DoxX family membrane protein [Propioniciclava soli]|uniref:DoxX family membrane protein n=1 Tax=Propioniciclava soli TaxID=2775081 RepID=A0ABZ3C368_9ACTN|nr:DoxX family membrane protein [Propioniciclava soli]